MHIKCKHNEKLCIFMVKLFITNVLPIWYQWEIDYRKLFEVCPIVSDSFIGSDKSIGWLFSVEFR